MPFFFSIVCIYNVLEEWGDWLPLGLVEGTKPLPKADVSRHDANEMK